ncbi:MAG: type II secretion system protein N [Marinobacter sp.]
MTESASTSFIRPGKVLLLLLVGLLVYLVALVVWVPAGWIWHQASSYITLPPQVQVQRVSGTVWQGNATAVIAGYPARAGWELGWPSVSARQWPVSISLISSQSRLAGDVTVGWPGTVQLDAQGRIAVSEFEDLIRQSGGAMIEGDVSIDRLQVAWKDNRLADARGYGSWAGGLVTWPMGNQTGRADFPPMEANLDTTDNGIGLTVQEQGGAGPAADANIQWNGMMELRVYKRMVDLADQPWSGSAQPDDVVFSVRQPLLPGGF